VPHIKKSAVIRQKTKNLVVGFRWEPDAKTDQLTVGRKLTSTSTAGSKSEAVCEDSFARQGEISDGLEAQLCTHAINNSLKFINEVMGRLL
jgi:hypothetical protein